jgi:DNA polymerase-1
LISKQLVTLKNDVPLKNDPAEFYIKDINKDKLYEFLREMEFNRLLKPSN